MVLLLVSLHLAEFVLALLHADEKEDAVDCVRMLTSELAAADDQVAGLGLLEELLLADAEKGPELEALFQLVTLLEPRDVKIALAADRLLQRGLDCCLPLLRVRPRAPEVEYTR